MKLQLVDASFSFDLFTTTIWPWDNRILLFKPLCVPFAHLATWRRSWQWGTGFKVVWVQTASYQPEEQTTCTLTTRWHNLRDRPSPDRRQSLFISIDYWRYYYYTTRTCETRASDTTYPTLGHEIMTKEISTETYHPLLLTYQLCLVLLAPAP